MEEQSTSMAEQFIYHMRDLKKVYTGGKEVLKGIHLSFYPGAKIGVIGNGAGKLPYSNHGWTRL